MASEKFVAAPASDLFVDDAISKDLADVLRQVGTGGRLPAERDLALQLKVSRTALRDRLGMLEGLGVLRRRPGSGTYVQKLHPRGLTVALSLGISSSDIPLESLESVRIY